MWQKDQKSICALVLAIVNEAHTPRQHDRFVRIGHCWLNGRSKSLSLSHQGRARNNFTLIITLIL